MSACRSCGSPVTWGETSNGKRAPFDPDGTNHFATCPQANDWRKPAPKQTTFLDEPAPAPRPRGYFED